MKKKDEKGLIRKESDAITAEMILQHPVVKEMAARLENVQKLLQHLPEAIGRAVAEASAPKPPMPPPAPGQPLCVVKPTPIEFGVPIELHPQRMVAGGATFDLPKPSKKLPD